MTPDEIFALVAEERRSLADLLDGLSDAQWAAPSLCAGWRVREVAAHLAMPFTTSLPRVVLGVLRRRGDVNAFLDDRARKETRGNAELVALLRANAEHRFTPPGSGPEAPLTDTVTHGQDIARPLGIDRPVSARSAEVALGMLTSGRGQKFFGGPITDGLSFTSIDTGWRFGSGAEVAGSAAALVTSLGRRTAALDELTGDGVAILRQRLAVG
ncbi:MAG: maleylpyruvate isomerase family mycothiol-dependent enzyme [Pseudonocardia sp.]